MVEDNEPRASRSPADKEESRRQSRAVSGKQAARSVGADPRKGKGKAGTSATGAPKNGRGTTTGSPRGPASKRPPEKAPGSKAPAATRPGNRPSAKNGSRPGGRRRGGGGRPGGRPGRLGGRSRATLFTWGTIALVIVVVAVLVIVKVFSSSTAPPTSTVITPVPASIMQDITSVPTSVYDKVGVTSPASITPPTVAGQTTPGLTIAGKPGMFYLGGEFCPYCAAERWAMVTALARFGKFSGLGEMESSPTDLAPNTQTFTFHGATFASTYLGFRPVEHYSNVPDTATGYYTQLEPLTKADQKLLKTYYTTKYLPGITSGQVGIPFVDIGNKVFVYQSSQFSPTILAGLTRQQIASGLSDPTNPVTQAIIASSNYLSAGICATNGQQPSSVCSSKGVTAAAKALKLSA